MLAFLIAFVASFFGSMPIGGPIAVIIVACGLRDLHGKGLAVAAGATFAEIFYAFFAYWGTGALFSAHPTIMAVAKAVAALVLIIFGTVLLVTGKHGGDDRPGRVKDGFLLGFTIAGLNPAFIATWAAVAAFINSTGLTTGSLTEAALFVAGVAGGSMVGAWVLLQVISRHKRRFQPKTVDRMVRAGGALLVILGLCSAISFAMP